MIRESVAPNDFQDYSGVDFPDVETYDVDEKYKSIKPSIPDKISLRDYNQLQINALKEYIRGRLNHYKDITDSQLNKFVNELIHKHPSVVKKARLHLAATEPELFDYV